LCRIIPHLGSGIAYSKKQRLPPGFVSVVDSNGRTIWIADAHRDNGKRFVARSDEKLTAFLELEKVTQMISMGEREEN
jgi:hypothetical protein